VIVRCADPADVVAAVNFARDQHQVVAVHSGGHSAAGSSVCDGGFMIDLSPMKGIRVDPARATVRAEAGLTGAEFDAETQAFGLATTSGVVSTTSIAGLTLGGGIGWLGRTYGLSCDNLISVDVVTADGQLRTASADENADLFWAVRGGGGNFGVVTSFEYRLHRVGPTVLAGLLVWPRPMALDVYGGATNRVGVQDTAYPLRDATYALNAISAWTDPAQDQANIAWSQALWEAMQPYSPGSVYFNFLGIGDEGDDRVKAAYGPNYARLAQIKAIYDPQNLFRLNHNIRPAR
jgi:FAD/FMN-containing dehydrogenase